MWCCFYTVTHVTFLPLAPRNRVIALGVPVAIGKVILIDTVAHSWVNGIWRADRRKHCRRPVVEPHRLLAFLSIQPSVWPATFRPAGVAFDPPLIFGPVVMSDRKQQRSLEMLRPNPNWHRLRDQSTQTAAQGKLP